MNIELKGIHKHFGAIHANDGIDITVNAGTIQGILGENGAGKSTLMKILSGFIQADSGEILLDGKVIKIQSPADAIHYGIGMLHQDPLDFPPLRVIDNFILGKAGGLLPDYAGAKKALLDLEKEFDFFVDPDTYVDTLTVGERQQMEVLRLLWLGAKVLILDEPTTGISALQKEKLFKTLKVLAGQGMTVIFVSHKLDEVEILCSQVAVFRKGKMVGEMQPPYVTSELVRLMFGKVVSLAERVDNQLLEPLLEVQSLGLEDYRLKIRDVDLSASRGEVIGLAGMEGSGQLLFMQACAGLVRPVAGKLIIGGEDLTGKPYHAFLQRGIAYMPAARLEQGLIPGLTLAEHFVLAEKADGFFVNGDRAVGLAQDRITDYNIKGNPVSRVEELSGGNQQRALLSLLRTPLNLLLMEHPTRGLDIESSIWIWGKLKERCKQSTTILFISSDLEEILHYSDRIVVFFGGRVSRTLDARATTVDQLGQLIGGKGWEQAG